MFISDLKSAIRNIVRNRITSLISVLGLGIGLGCLIILMALIIHEKSFDRYIPAHKNVFRVTIGNIGLTQYPLAEAITDEFPEVKDYFRYFRALNVQVKTKDNAIISETELAFADTSIFRILGVKLLSGTPAMAPGEIALSRDAARKYFGELSCLGQVLPVKMGEGFTPFTVSGIYENLPSNSTLYPSLITDLRVSEKLINTFQNSLGDFGNKKMAVPDWTNSEFLTYVVLERNTDPAGLASRMEKYKEFLKLENKNELHYKLQPVTDIYLRSEGISGNHFLRQGNSGELVYYEVISLLILAISLANYILLTRAGVADRMMNIGTRKAFGASNDKIRMLIILESNLIVLLSMIPATFIIEYGMKLINSALNKNLSAGVFLNPVLWILLVAVLLLTGTLAGWLIGLHYSKIPALDLISGKLRKTGRAGRWNYSFLVLHFMIFMIFASGIIAVSKQINYSRTGYKGLNPENILVAELTSEKLMSSYNTIKNEMESVAGVISVAGGTFIPPFGNFLPVTLATTEGSKIRFDGLIMGEGMTELLGIEVIDGTSFGSYKGGTPEVLINEATAKQHNVQAGEKLLAFTVKGVVKDFHAHSLHTEIQPLVILQQNPERLSLIAIKTDGRNDAVIMDRLRQLFSGISPDELFEAGYLTDRIEAFYERERNQARIIGAFAILAAVLSVMGLFGISVISIARRRKEIGLRKVNGAARHEVLLLVNIDFLRWVLIAFVLSVPVSIFLLNKWLERFAYKTTLSWWIFALAGLLAIVIAILTVSWQSIKAASRNPVESIRYE